MCTANERIAPYHFPEAGTLIGAIDPDDVPFFVFARADEHEGIWSNDRLSPPDPEGGNLRLD